MCLFQQRIELPLSWRWLNLDQVDVIPSETSEQAHYTTGCKNPEINQLNICINYERHCTENCNPVYYGLRPLSRVFCVCVRAHIYIYIYKLHRKWKWTNVCVFMRFVILVAVLMEIPIVWGDTM
jgi:hypothetical protein